MSDLQPKQFRQQRLFAPLGMTKQPHEQSPLEFANSPRSWWHAGQEPSMAMMRAQNVRGPKEQGFHIGPKDVALNRRSDDKTYIHAGRPNMGMLKNPDRPIGDRGEDWNEYHHDKVYRNDYESSTNQPQPSIIFQDPGPERFKTHTDHVREAMAEGKPNVNRIGEYIAKREDRLMAAVDRTPLANSARVRRLSSDLGLGRKGPQSGLSMRVHEASREFPDDENHKPPTVRLEPSDSDWPRTTDIQQGAWYDEKALNKSGWAGVWRKPEQQRLFEDDR